MAVVWRAIPSTLVYVSQIGNCQEINVSITASEGTSVYEGKILQEDVNGLKSSRNYESDSSWNKILYYILLRNKDLPNELEFKQLVVTSNVKNDKMIITIIKKLNDIEIILGSFELQESDSDIQLFDWLLLSCSENEKKNLEINKLNTIIKEKENRIKNLRESFNNIYNEKEKWQQEIMIQMTNLLNYKKLKIRELNNQITDITTKESGENLFSYVKKQRSLKVDNIDQIVKKEDEETTEEE